MTEQGKHLPQIMAPGQLGAELDPSTGTLTVALNLATIAAAPQKITAPIHVWLRVMEQANKAIAQALEASLAQAQGLDGTPFSGKLHRI